MCSLWPGHGPQETTASRKGELNLLLAISPTKNCNHNNYFTIQASPECTLSRRALKELVQDSLQSFSTDEVSRKCQHICVSYACQLRGLESKLASLENKNDILDCFCNEVGLKDVRPLLSLMDLLSVDIQSAKVLKCKEMLLQHQARTDDDQEGLSVY